MKIILQTIPTPVSIFCVVFEAFQDSSIKWTAERPFRGVCVSVNDERDGRFLFKIGVKQREIFLIDYDRICFRMVKYV